jgi:hypothetical protein
VKVRRIVITLGIVGLSWFVSAAHAEQKKQIGQYEVHYIVIPTTFLQAKIADEYDLVRGRDRSLINISVLDANNVPVSVQITGSTRNLLEQRQKFNFRQITEGEAVYYLAVLRHADEEHHRLSFQFSFPDGTSGGLNWQQKLYWEAQ